VYKKNQDKQLGMTVDRETPLRVVGFTDPDQDGRFSEGPVRISKFKILNIQYSNNVFRFK
jgi:hypothetical protein